MMPLNATESTAEYIDFINFDKTASYFAFKTAADLHELVRLLMYKKRD